MILLDEYFGPWRHHADATDERVYNAGVLLIPVNDLLNEAFNAGVDLEINPNTKTHIAGATFGGFRPQSCPQGAPGSSHKQGRGVDIFDPVNALDNWITDAILTRHGLYREAPLSTKGWCHLTDRAPHSGKRTFLP